MKQFSFKLEPVLNYRQYLERLAQQETARAQMDVKASESLIQRLQSDLIFQTDKMDTTLEQGMTSTEFKRFYSFFQGTRTQINDEEKRKQILEKKLVEKIKILKKKSVDKRAMEIYRDKLRQEYNQQLDKIEQKELDEISSIKTARTINNETD